MTALRIAVLFPDLLGTYGDGGNGLVLLRRAEWRGVEADLLQVASSDPLPAADVYLLGGGEDAPQTRAAALLGETGRLASAVAEGAVLLAVCAGYQIAGTSFAGPDGPADGLGILDVSTAKGDGPRAVGEVVAEPGGHGPRRSSGADLATLTGFENHGGVTARGPGARPLAAVVTGVGNGVGDATEGAWRDRVVGTYLHGPVLARNPDLADLLLEWALGRALDPLPDEEERGLRRTLLGGMRS